MAAALKAVFTAKALENKPVFVTFLTAGYPLIASTVPLMLAMQAGGADVIELGVPFTDPLADGKAIQDANNVSFFIFGPSPFLATLESLLISICFSVLSIKE